MSTPFLFAHLVAIALVGLVIPSASAQVAGSPKPSTTGANPGNGRPAGFGQYLSTNPYRTPQTLTAARSGYSNPPSAYGGYGGYGYRPQVLTGYGSTLQGAASVIDATGQRNISNQQASILREQKRQMSYQTTRDRVNLEMEYEDLKNRRYRQGLENDRQRALETARRNPTDTDIWSGRTLNLLLKSILLAPAPTRGPNVYLSPEMVAALNLTDGASKGSLALAKDEGKIDWTDALGGTAFDAPRKQFTENFALAMKAAQAGKKSDRATLKGLQADLKSLGSLLDDQVATLSPSDYIVSRRLLKKLKEGVEGLSSSRLIASCNDTWKKNVHNVAALVTYCQQNGLEFAGAAASGDKEYYTAAYLAIRTYERGTAQMASAR
jgi:hypothetical protein